MTRHVTGLAALVSILVLPHLLWAEQVSVRGGRFSVQLDAQRRAKLRDVTDSLRANNVPAYGVLYKTTRTKQQHEGATLVASVTTPSRWGEPRPDTVSGWYEAVGKRSIGFQTSAGPTSTGGSSGYVRVGKQWMEYNWVRGGYGSSEDIRQHYGTLTEATFLVSEPEMAAFSAFYHARHHKLIKDSKGQPIDPQWNNPGPSNMKREGCAGAASSGLNPAWVKAFKRNLAAIKQYGQQNNIPELANAPANAAELMKQFINRTGCRQQTDPRVLVRTHSTSADMLTVFNGGVQGDPIQNLEWNRKVQWYIKPSWSPNAGQRVRDKNNPNWSGLGSPHTILDNPNSKPAKSYMTERIGLSAFGQAL